MWKSSNLEVRPITSKRYQDLSNGQYNALVDLTEWTYTCRKFQLSQIPYIHVIIVVRYMKLTTCIQWVHPYYNTVFYRTVYAEVVNPLGDQSKWIHLEEASVIHLPFMHHCCVVRPANKNKCLSQGEIVEQLICSRCHKPRHTRQNCKSSISISSFAPPSLGRKKKNGR